MSGVGAGSGGALGGRNQINNQLRINSCVLWTCRRTPRVSQGAERARLQLHWSTDEIGW